MRAHTLPGLLGVQKNPQTTFKAWIQNNRYRINTPINPKSFELELYDKEELLEAISYDINRMSCSAIETVALISRSSVMPKSSGWAIIELYYSAYFSAQAIMRIFGVSCSQFDSQESIAVTNAAKLYHQDNGINISAGYYHCEYMPSNNLISCNQLGNTHQSFWTKFDQLLDDLSTKVSGSNFLERDKNKVIQFLFSIRERLNYWNNYNSSNWLSKVRNDVNYSHAMGAWYPYTGSKKVSDELFRIISRWNQEEFPSNITNHEKHPNTIVFADSCLSIIKLLKDLINDLSSHSDKSFLEYGPVRLMKQLAI